jgi:hypothetical protein
LRKIDCATPPSSLADPPTCAGKEVAVGQVMTRIFPLLLVAACGSNPAAPDGATTGDDTQSDAAPADAPVSGELPALQLCTIANPTNVSSAFTVVKDATTARYACVQPCTAASCAVGFADAGGPINSLRGGQMQVIAFVVDGMAGHFVFTPDGDDVVVTHGGVGGTGLLHTEFDGELQAHSTLRTVSLGWEGGVGVFGNSGTGGSGWFTRGSATGTSVRALAGRPAAAIAWAKATWGAGKKLGTVGASLGTVATFGAHVWYGLDSIIDYQILIGGPPMWDVNMGCGRAHTSAGHCDVDATACTGNPNSSYGNDDPACSSETNQCRVPTVMAEIPGGPSEYQNIINYVTASTACSASDTRSTMLDESSLAFTVDNWTFHGRVDLVTQEGAPQPPYSDQGMGEGHAMYVYQAIQSDKRWIDDDGHHHGDAWQKDAQLVADTAQIVIQAMGH